MQPWISRASLAGESEVVAVEPGKALEDHGAPFVREFPLWQILLRPGHCRFVLGSKGVPFLSRGEGVANAMAKNNRTGRDGLADEDRAECNRRGVR